jgi:hypothetical protein
MSRTEHNIVIDMLIVYDNHVFAADTVERTLPLWHPKLGQATVALRARGKQPARTAIVETRVVFIHFLVCSH